MSLFIFMYLIIYGTLHLHFYIRLAGTIPMTGRLRILVLGVLMVLFFSPILTRLSEGMGQGKIALAFSWGGYLWMGFVFLFFVLSLPLELWRLMASLGARRAVLPSPRVVFFLPMVMAVLLCGYGYLEARQIHVEHITIRASKPALAGKRIRIVQLSDVHVGLIVRGERLQAIIDAVRREEPHVVVSTGDLVDGQMDNLQEAEALFRNLQPPGGKYAVLGNHELYAGLNKALRFIEGGGFHILRGEAVMPLPGLYLAGVDDAVVVEAGLGKGKAVRDLGGAVPVGVFSLLLKHRPTVDEGGYPHFDLQLSGHTHGGQIFPFSLASSLFFPYHRGNYNLPSGLRLHVSRGTGTWGPPIRLASPPEITVIDIQP